METLNNNDELINDGGKRCTIFVIDFGDHVLADCLRFALQAVRDRINFLCCTGGLNELAAVIFINTSITNRDAESIDCIFVYRPIKTLDVAFVQELDTLLKEKDKIRSKLANTLGKESGICNWGEVLFLCQRMFTYSENVLRRREVQFFTVDHDPIMGDQNILRKVLSYKTDLEAKNTQMNICLTDLALKKNTNENTNIENNVKNGEVLNNETQNFNSFWTNIDSNVLQSSLMPFFRNKIKSKDYALRTLTSIPLKLGLDVEIAVGIYLLIKEQSKPVAIPLDAETNEQLEYRSHYVSNGNCDNNLINHNNNRNNGAKLGAEDCFEGEVNFKSQIGGVNVVLDRTELESLRRFDKPGITIIGFKPMQCLKQSHRMGISKFILPLDKEIKGSATLYKALYKKCFERKIFILVRYTEKTNTAPQLAALIPQEKSTTNSIFNETYCYEGFHLIELPFAEDKRNLKERFAAPNGYEKWPLPLTEQVNAAKAFIDRLNAAYGPHQFTNPVLQRFYTGLEAMALDLDTLEGDPDLVKKKFDKIRPYYEDEALVKRVSSQLENLKQVLPSYEPVVAKKRGRTSKESTKETN